MMQACTYCGGDVPDDWKECTTCGWLRDGSLALPLEPAKCPYCGDDVPEDWEECPSCGWLRDGSLGIASPEPPPPSVRQLICLRCQAQMTFLGFKQFRESSNSLDILQGRFGSFRHDFQILELHGCGYCGYAELALPHIGS